MVNAQTWLDKNYPENNRENFTSLNIQAKKLKGVLNLKGFVNVKILNLQTNQLTAVDISDLKRLEKFFGSNNLLTSIDFSAQDPKLLNEIYLSNNNFCPCDLNLFSDFINLRCLYIGTSRKKKGYEKGIYNRFLGSLSCLKNFNKLEELDIDNTDIDSGLQDLSIARLSQFCCSSRREGAKVEIIGNILSLSEEVAKSIEVGENRYKIEKIELFQSAHELLSKKEFNLAIKQSGMKPTYLQSLLDVQLEVYRLQLLRENQFLSALIDPVLRDKYQLLRKIKQEIVIDREDEEGLTWQKIDNVCKSQIDLSDRLLYLIRKKKEIEEKIFLFRGLKKEVENALENLFLRTKKEIKQLKEIEGIENIFLSEGFDEEEWYNCNCYCRISIVSALSYHLKYHLNEKNNILKFGKDLLELINNFGKESKKRKFREIDQREQQEIQLESQIQVSDFPSKR